MNLVATVTQLLTADDLLRMPNDGQRRELIQGELQTMPPAGFEHCNTGSRLLAHLLLYAEGKRLGKVVGADAGFVIAHNPDTVRAPDIGFVRQDRIPAGPLTPQYYRGAPDLAVEVVSPGDTVFEVDEKVQQWLDAGTALVWVVNPRRHTVTVYRPGATPTILTAADTLDGLDVVPGFTVRVGDIFPS